MDEDQLKIHGSLFFLLKKFLDDCFSYGTWEKFLIQTGTADITFEATKNYPIEIFNAIVTAAAKQAGTTENEFKEKFGKHLVTDLLIFYAAYLKPHWKTFELLENTEAVMHHAVRQLSRSANPPILHISKVDDSLLIIDYYSKRKLSSLGIGIIKGIAAFYGEKDRVTVVPTTDPDDERVQIRVEFAELL